MKMLKTAVIFTLTWTMAFAHGARSPRIKKETDVVPPTTAQTVASAADECTEKLVPHGSAAQPDENYKKILRQQAALKRLSVALPKVFANEDLTKDPNFQLLLQLIIPEGTLPSDMVVMVLTGAALMGKSSFANSFQGLLHGEPFAPEKILSPPGRRGGTTQRALIYIPNDKGPMLDLRVAELKTRFPKMERLKDREQLKTPGPPLYEMIDWPGPHANLIIVDAPDITTGNLLIDADPVNRETAREVLVGADLVLVFMADHNMRDLNTNRLIADNFRAYGKRNSVFFLKTVLRSPEERAESQDWLSETAKSIYGVSNKDPMPAEVRSLYAVRDDRDTGQTIHPLIIPFEGYPAFQPFFEGISRDSAAIRIHSARVIAGTFYGGLRKKLDPVLRAQAAREIYRAAMAGVMSQEPNPIAFPYEDVATHWRAKLSAQSGRASRLTNDAAKLPAEAVRTVKTKSRRLFSWGQIGKPVPFEDVVRGTDEAIKTSWVNHYNAVTRELQQRKLTVPAAAVERLAALITQFNALIDDGDRLTIPAVVPGSDHVTVELPAIGYLDAESRTALEAIFSTNFTSALNPPTDPLVQEKNLIMTAERLDEQFAVIGNDAYGSDQWSRDFVTNALSTVSAYIAPAGLLAVPAVTLPPIAFAWCAGMTAATLIRLHLEGRIDGDLKPVLTTWFAGLQTSLFKQQTTRLFGPLESKFDPSHSPERNEDLETVMDALRELGVFGTEAAR